MKNKLFEQAEEVEVYLGRLHNIASKVQIGAARAIWLKAHRAFQTARCEIRRRRAEKMLMQLNILVESSLELCDLAKESGQFPEICAAANCAITALRSKLDEQGAHS